MTPRPLFHVSNQHRLDAPFFSDALSTQYIGYFQNRNGEQLVFVYDDLTASGTLYHGDADWVPYPLSNEGIPDNLVLSADEQLWLDLCWRAAQAVFWKPPTEDNLAQS